MDLSHYHLSASPFFDGSCGAWPKVPDEFLGQAPNLVFFLWVWNFLQWENLLEPIRRPKKRCFRPTFYSVTLCMCFPSRLKFS